MNEASPHSTRRDVVVAFGANMGQRTALRRAVGEHVVFLADLGGEERVDALASADVVLTWNPRGELSDPELHALEGVGLIQLLSAGADHLPFEKLPAGPVVASNVGAYAEPMAEHVAAMVLALARRLPQKHAELVRGEFHQWPPTRTLRGAVCGILGFGGIGKAVAALMRPLGARIHAVNTGGTTGEPVEWIGTLANLDTVLAASDVLVIALPLTRRTRGLIDARELGLMKPEAILVNVARGAIVNEEALYRHLAEHPDFMAGIDAWWTEPFGGGEFRTRFPFFGLPNLLGSPHNSAIVPEIEVVAVRRAAENVARYLRGEPIRGEVRREDYESAPAETGGASA